MGRPAKKPLAPLGEALRAAIDRSPHVSTRSEFLRRVPIDNAQLRRYETGEVEARIGHLRRWAEVLGCAVAELWPPAGGAAELDGAPEAFRAFLASYAPADLTDAELRWPREAPCRVPPAGPGVYADLLQLVRGA